MSIHNKMMKRTIDILVKDDNYIKLLQIYLKCTKQTCKKYYNEFKKLTENTLSMIFLMNI
jgi:hypothetical protein